MSAHTRLTSIAESLTDLIQTTFPSQAPEAENLIGDLHSLAFDLKFVEPALRQVCDLNGAFTLVAQLLDAAHTDKLDADQIKCLLDPLRERLELSTAELTRVLA